MKDEIARAKVKAERKAARKAAKRQNKAEGKKRRDDERTAHWAATFRDVYKFKPGRTIQMRKKDGATMPITIT